MNELTWHDLQFALLRCPKQLLKLMKSPEWKDKIFVGGGFLRSIVAGEPINDVDVFVPDASLATELALALNAEKIGEGKDEPFTDEQFAQIGRMWKTDNAITLLGFKPHIQIIHRWTFGSGRAVADSFDFTCCCASFWWDGVQWASFADDRFYPDVAAKRLVYRKPVRNEDAGGSMLRVLKYYQKGYRIPLDSLAAVVARMMKGYELSFSETDTAAINEDRCAKIVCGLLREVDPHIDPNHVAHLPAEDVSRGRGATFTELEP